jgi:aspartate racemase
MGPEAAIDLQMKILRLTPATTDQAHLPVVVWNVPQIPDRTAAIFGDGESPLAAMADGVAALERLGAQHMVIACNTAHHWFDALQEKTKVPMTHIADAVYAELCRAESPVTHVGLMATSGTIRSNFYAMRLAARGCSMIIPDQSAQQHLSHAIQLIKAGQYDDAATIVDKAAQELLDLGAQRLILGCTELPLVIQQLSVGHLCIDATAALARVAVQACHQAT